MPRTRPGRETTRKHYEPREQDKAAARAFREYEEAAPVDEGYVMTREDAAARDRARLAALATPRAKTGGTDIQLAYCEVRTTLSHPGAVHAIAVRFGLDDNTVERTLDRAAAVDRKAGQTPITEAVDREARRARYERKNGAPAVAQAMRRAGASRAVVIPEVARVDAEAGQGAEACLVCDAKISAERRDAGARYCGTKHRKVANMARTIARGLPAPEGFPASVVQAAEKYAERLAKATA